jgi:nucleoside 2-deoxyribosyltransferase
MNAYLICPVRGKDSRAYADVVEKLESEGKTVYWPARDTDQGDITGYRICESNAAAIERADVVYVVWDGKSEGCLFDLGIAFALRKPIIPIDIPPPTSTKSFQNMISEWARNHSA